MAIFYLAPSKKDGKFYFRLEDNNNKIILSSFEGYKTKQGCRNVISYVKINAPFDSKYHRFSGEDGLGYFTLKSANSEPIGISEGYLTIYRRDKGIENCKIEAPYATIKELKFYYV